MPIIAGLFAWPLIEIALFVTLGGWLGLWWTLAIVIGTAAGGIALMRWRGTRALGGLRQGMQNLGTVIPVAADQALFMLAGVLLVLPGFLTDVLGLLLLLPPVRLLLISMAARRVVIHGAGRRGAQDDDIIDGDFKRVEPAPPVSGRPSGWTQD